MHAPHPATTKLMRRIGIGLSLLALAAVGPTDSATAQPSRATHQSVPATAKVANRCVTTTSAGPAPHPEDVRFYQARKSLLGLHRWYTQRRDGFPVVDGWWGWHRNRNTHEITVDDCRVAAPKLNTTTPTVRLSEAIGTAKAGGRGRVLAARLMAFPHRDVTRLVWATTTLSRGAARTSYVDALNSQVLKTTVISHAARSPKFTVGTARVFDPNPIVKLQNESLHDDGDSARAVPANAYSARDLPRLVGNGRTLAGKWVKITNDDRATSPTATYNYSRHNDYFEQVMTYYGIDSEQAYLQSLGFDDVNAEAQKASVNTIADDNSMYVGNTDRIIMGTGGVDDAEDVEVTWHEYGHAVQDDQIPHFGLRYQGASMGEGFGDYMAASMSQAHGKDTAKTPVGCVMDWDSTSYTAGAPHCIRRTDTAKTWSGTPDGDPHADGEIWSAALWDINQQLGRDEATTIIVEAQFWMNPKIGFRRGAQTTVAAARLLYPDDADVVTEAFASRKLIPRR